MVDKNFEIMQDEWATDVKIDETNLDKESAKIPLLHAEYLRELSNARIKYQSLKLIEKEKRLELENYFKGAYNENKDKLKELGKSPLERSITKTQINQYVETDENMQMILVKVIVQGEVVDFLLECLKHINQRNFIITNIIKWKALTQFGEG